MNTANKNHLNILDLPNEILLIICKELNMVDVLYSIVDVNERFNQLILDHLYIRHLNMTTMTIRSVFDRIYSIDDQVLSRICKQILPRIRHQVNQLTVEPHSMDRLLTLNYSQLYSLSLVDFQEKILLQYLKGNSILCNLLSEQITHLCIDMEVKTVMPPLSKTLSEIFILILSLCKRLVYLNVCSSSRYRLMAVHIFKPSTTNCTSSTLTTLNINVDNFADCLYLLDGRLNCLSTLIICILKISPVISKIKNTKELPKLKSFSLTSVYPIMAYDSLIIPLLRRMINLEELILFLSVIRFDSTYIDGIQLQDEVLIYMPRLKKFTFSIDTRLFNNNIKIDLRSNEEIQRSFIGRVNGQIGSDVQTIVMKNAGICHVYSLPYQFEDFCHLNNSFQGGMFHKVQCLIMTDETYSFEHYFFQVISQDFPFLKELYIVNCQPQKDKQHSSTLIRFPYLLLLSLVMAHMDYVEEFLFDKNIHLPRLLNLFIKYEPLAIVTNNFTNDAARATCGKLKCLEISEPFVCPENFHQYFPLLL
ncbi:unnamed protein product [Rotaria sp. Silwood1]|nr:unnamed protein product [Rotaria sp. Silwood1]CAF4720312.1 unnamed protein product [Rotaria sp. Silwood1]